MKRAALLLLLLCACDMAGPHDGPQARIVASETLARCRTICPAGTTPMVVATYNTDLWASTWSCGCLDAAAKDGRR